MLQLPEAVRCRFDNAMSDAGVAHAERWHFKKWLRYYLDFCAKYRLPPGEEASEAPFIEKLAVGSRTGSAEGATIQALIATARRSVGGGVPPS